MDVENLPAGTVLFDRYRVVRTLGTGGMGVVICAEDIDRQMPVAIKFLLPAVAEKPEMAVRFMREAIAASKIAGEFVVHVIDVGRSPVPHMIMEYLEGEDLSSYRKAHPNMPVEEAIEYIVHAGTALVAAHQIGIVHRDIKPANLFRTVSADGSPLVKVLDFGISKFVGEDAAMHQITKTTAVMGSVAYMSPEQMRSMKHVDHRTDIYSLGVCLYELLTGTQPYVADSALALAAKVSADPPDPIRRYRKDVPPVLAAVLEKAYARTPEERYPNIQSFLRDLAPFGSESARAQIDAILGTNEATSRRRRNSMPLPSEGRIEAEVTQPEGGISKGPEDRVTTAPERAVVTVPDGSSTTASKGHVDSPPITTSSVASAPVRRRANLTLPILVIGLFLAAALYLLSARTSVGDEASQEPTVPTARESAPVKPPPISSATGPRETSPAPRPEPTSSASQNPQAPEPTGSASASVPTPVVKPPPSRVRRKECKNDDGVIIPCPKK